jgi:HD superfamily phosphohydrolase
MALRLAALLHDIGHYPFSHTLEEAGFASHEQLGVMRLVEGELGALLEKLGGPGFREDARCADRGRQHQPGGGAHLGSLDLDKIDYSQP